MSNFESPNKTEKDARIRVQQARVGCLAGEPTEQYLDQLQAEIWKWQASVDAYRAESNA